MSTEVIAAVDAPQSVESKPVGMRKNGELGLSACTSLEKQYCRDLNANGTYQENNGMLHDPLSVQKPAILHLRSVKRSGKPWTQ
jgi:hypothetical protein